MQFMQRYLQLLLHTDVSVPSHPASAVHNLAHPASSQITASGQDPRILSVMNFRISKSTLATARGATGGAMCLVKGEVEMSKRSKAPYPRKDRGGVGNRKWTIIESGGRGRRGCNEAEGELPAP